MQQQIEARLTASRWHTYPIDAWPYYEPELGVRRFIGDADPDMLPSHHPGPPPEPPSDPTDRHAYAFLPNEAADFARRCWLQEMWDWERCMDAWDCYRVRSQLGDKLWLEEIVAWEGKHLLSDELCHAVERLGL